MKNNYFFNTVSFPFLMDLYRIKLKAEARDDKKAIESLQLHYPELFISEFDEFIQKVQMLAQYIDQKYDKNLSDMFRIDDNSKNKITH